MGKLWVLISVLLSLSLIQCSSPDVRLQDPLPLSATKILAPDSFVLVQAKLPSTQSKVEFTLTDERGKNVKWVFNDESALYSWPSGKSFYISRIVLDGQEIPIIEAKKYRLETISGKVAHAGFFWFRTDLKKPEVWKMPVAEASDLLKKALGQYQISISDVLNGYTLKPMTLETENPLSVVKKVSMKKAYIDYMTQAFKCVNTEERSNRIFLGTLRVEAQVQLGNVVETTLLKSKHTASREYEECILKSVQTAKGLKENSYTIEVPGVLTR